MAFFLLFFMYLIFITSPDFSVLYVVIKVCSLYSGHFLPVCLVVHWLSLSISFFASENREQLYKLHGWKFMVLFLLAYSGFLCVRINPHNSGICLICSSRITISVVEMIYTYINVSLCFQLILNLLSTFVGMLLMFLVDQSLLQLEIAPMVLMWLYGIRWLHLQPLELPLYVMKVFLLVWNCTWWKWLHVTIFIYPSLLICSGMCRYI